jgi:hypothetical protein
VAVCLLQLTVHVPRSGAQQRECLVANVAVLVQAWRILLHGSMLAIDFLGAHDSSLFWCAVGARLRPRDARTDMHVVSQHGVLLLE